jgi:hypothetical protein
LSAAGGADGFCKQYRTADERRLLASIMMRIALGRIVAAMYLAIALGVGWLGIRAMAPSEATLANRPSVFVPPLAPGEFNYLTDPLAIPSWPSELLAVRQRDGRLKVFRIPMIEGLHAIPDVHWWKPAWPCNHLEPNFELGIIHCRDAQAGEWVRSLTWSLDGRFLGREMKMDDMSVATEQGEVGHELLLIR